MALSAEKKAASAKSLGFIASMLATAGGYVALGPMAMAIPLGGAVLNMFVDTSKPTIWGGLIEGAGMAVAQASNGGRIL